MKVIINADDLGYAQSENQAIFQAISQNKITSTTIMAIGDAFDQATQQIPNYQHNCSFGIHLTATEFQPLTNSQLYHDLNLLNPQGHFNTNLRSCPKNARKSLSIQLEKEFSQQVIKCLDHKIPLSHIDSHHHIHTIPWLYPTIKSLQKKFSISKIRNTKNLYLPQEQASFKLLLLKKAWSINLKLCRTQTTHYFTDVTTFLNLNNSNINSNHTIELMCHPGKTDGYATEEKLLYTPWQEKCKFPIQLISYNQL